METRKLQILLHDHRRSEDDLREVARILEEEGLHLSGQGAASLSARISDSDFKKLFPATGNNQSLTVPERLKPFVSSISEAPEHLSF